ncbi:TetR/AcrR family transcriptional regulator [Longimycelium tulufanense]|nr:TetR/AcrR family transcriptional regulator [Longimycelium tulufanense]
MGRSVKTQPGEGGDRSDARKERWRAHREARRAEFVDATMCAIKKHGADVGMDEIAAEAGVSKPVLYRHFADKADLYLAVAQRGTDVLMERMAPALDALAHDKVTPRQWIRGTVDTYLALIEQYPEMYRFVVRGQFVDRPPDRDLVAEDKRALASAIARIFGDYLRAFGMDSGGAEVWGHGVVGLVQGAGDWWLDRQSMSREAVTDYLTQIIWAAIEGVLRSSGLHLEPDQPFEEGVARALAERPVLRVVSDADQAGTGTTSSGG